MNWFSIVLQVLPLLTSAAEYFFPKKGDEKTGAQKLDFVVNSLPDAAIAAAGGVFTGGAADTVKLIKDALPIIKPFIEVTVRNQFNTTDEHDGMGS